MNVSNIPSSIWDKVSFQLSDDNITKGWKITRNIAAIVTVLGGILTGPACPITMTATTLWWIQSVTTVSGLIAFGAQATTGKKN